MRTIIIGDIHGCIDELRALLAKIRPQSDDRVISCGDIVRKGPDPIACLELWKENGYLAVQGNHETRVLDREGHLIQRYFGEDSKLLRRGDLVEWMRKWPLFLRFAKEKIVVVHGGVPPGGIDAMSKHDRQRWLPRLRYLRHTDEGWTPVSRNDTRSDDRFWTTLWEGPETVVYGHTPRKKVQQERRAIGIDTSCVYGGELTAAIHHKGEWSFLSVEARRAYAEKK